MILNKYEARIAGLESPRLPDVYDANAHYRPSDDFVVTRARDGTIVSYYCDQVWDISSWYSENKRSVLNFEFWKTNELTSSRNALSREARWLLFALIWLSDSGSVKPLTLQRYMTGLRAMALWVDRVSCGLQRLLSNADFFSDFLSGCTSSILKILGSMIFRLVRVPEAVLGFRIVGSKKIRELSKNSQGDNVHRQTPPIPTRIYSILLSTLSLELDDWESIAAEGLSLVRKCGQDPLYARRAACQRIKTKREESNAEIKLEWEDVASSQLRAYLSQKGHSDNIMGLQHAVTETQAVATLTIQAYSGMRRDECGSLPYMCREEVVSSGRAHLLMLGRTTKMVDGIKRTRWVTNHEGHRAAGIACQIADAIYDGCGVSQRGNDNWEKRKEDFPLFVSVAYLGLGSKKRTPPSDKFFSSRRATLDGLDTLRGRLQPIIEDSDITELEQIDAHRAWRSEKKFQLGSPWVFTSHQLRRSLALYAQGSGLVTLPSLRRQLQHITDEMAYYYSRGSEFAGDIFGEYSAERDHFCSEWQVSQTESEAISYVVHVLTSDDTLFGGHATFVKKRLSSIDGAISVSTREETIRMFKKGQLRYRATLIGGCTHAGECESPAIDWLNLECITKNCSNMVGNIRKLEKVIVEQDNFVQSLSKSSLLYRTENTILEKLRTAKFNAEAKGAI